MQINKIKSNAKINLALNITGKNKVLHKKIKHNLKVTMIHVNKDNSVPIIYSKKVLKIFRTNKKKLVIVKKGDHSLSSPKWLKILKRELKSIIN